MAEPRIRSVRTHIRLLIFALLLVLGLAAQPAIGAPAANRLADGTPIAQGADFVAPVPAGGRLPIVRYPKQLAAAGIQGHFEADVVVSSDGDVLDVIVK